MSGRTTAESVYTIEVVAIPAVVRSSRRTLDDQLLGGSNWVLLQFDIIEGLEGVLADSEN